MLVRNRNLLLVDEIRFWYITFFTDIKLSPFSNKSTLGFVLQLQEIFAPGA